MANIARSGRRTVSNDACVVAVFLSMFATPAVACADGPVGAVGACGCGGLVIPGALLYISGLLQLSGSARIAGGFLGAIAGLLAYVLASVPHLWPLILVAPLAPGIVVWLVPKPEKR